MHDPTPSGQLLDLVEKQKLGRPADELVVRRQQRIHRIAPQIR